MRTPSLISRCLPGLSQNDRGNQSASFSGRDSHLHSPAVEILPSKMYQQCDYAEDAIDSQGPQTSKRKFDIFDINNLSGSDIITSKSDGQYKAWECWIDLVNVLKHEIRDGKLNLRGKRVLELSSNYGLAGIFACLKGASTVHFQDGSAEAIRCATIPNVLASLERAREFQSRQPENTLTPSRNTFSPSVRFFAGDWGELHGVLSTVSAGGRPSSSEEDFADGFSSQEEAPSRGSRKLSGSRAWERASEGDERDGGYDVILIAEVPCSSSSLRKLYGLIKKCLRPPYGVVYLAMKRDYVGFGNAAKNLRGLVDGENIFGVHLVKEITDRDVWKFFLK